MTSPALTSIVANDEIHIRPKLEGTQRVVTHEILQDDAFDEADVSLRVHAKNKHLLESREKRRPRTRSGACAEKYSPWESG